MTDSHDVVVIGAGQAGLSISHELSHAGREHVVLERGALGQSWRRRWDSFTLVLPSWTVQFAGAPYQGPHPDSFMTREEFISHLTSYADSFSAPVHEGVAVTSLELEGGRFELETSAGRVRAREVVVATGGYQEPHYPAPIRELPPSVTVLDSTEYRKPDDLPPGDVLVVGSGQTGCQLAEELHDAGRTTYLSCGKAPWQLRRVGDKDSFWWISQSGFLDQTVADLPHPMARLAPNPQATGRRGGYDLHYRTLQAGGVRLLGHVAGYEEGRVHFADDLAETVAFGDARYQDICKLIAGVASRLGAAVPELPEPEPFVASSVSSLDVSRLAAVLVCSGYRPAYSKWIRIPQAFDAFGFPVQSDGSSTTLPGLHFMGVPFQRRRASATLFGVGRDAEVLAERMTTGAPVA